MVEQEKNTVKINKTFSHSRKSVSAFITQAEGISNILGGSVRKDIGSVVKNLKIRGIKLPESIGIATQIDDLDDTFIWITRYMPETNQLVLVRKYIMEDIGAKSDVEMGLAYLPKDKQEEVLVRTLENKEWLENEYGLKVIDKLHGLIPEPQKKNKVISSPIPPKR